MSFVATAQKTVVDPSGTEALYTYSAEAPTSELALQQVCIYASMVEYGMVAQVWGPSDMIFPKEQLYQFIQPSQLDVIESMYPNAVPTAYQNALSYVQSYIGNMFNVDEMLSSGETTTTAMSLRLALIICTVTYILSSSPQYSEVIEMHNRQLHMLLRGLKSGSRNMGKAGVIADPDVRVTVVSLKKTGAKP